MLLIHPVINIKHLFNSKWNSCHPHFADLWSSDIEKLVRSVLNNPRIVAIGECGLDSSRK